MVSLRRKILFSFFLLTFLIATPAISFYALGYKFKDGISFQKTGILILDSEPKNARVYIDNEIQQSFINQFLKKENFKLTPQKIKGLLPGEYHVKIELDDYWAWEKKLNVYAGQSTFAENIKLFKKEHPILLQKDVSSLSLSPNKNKMVAWNNEKISLITLPEGITLDLKIATSVSEPIWSKDSKKIIIDNYIIDTDNLEKISKVDEIIGKNVRNLQWDTENSDKIYYQNNKQIGMYDLSSREAKMIFSNKDINEYLPLGNTLYLITQTNNSSVFNIYDIESQTIVKTVNIPRSDYSLKYSTKSQITLFDESFNILFLINPDSIIRPLKETISNVSLVSWINDDELIYANDFEIWIFNKNSLEKKLITRISRKITSIFWLPTNGHILFSTDKDLSIVELDVREKYNITKIINLNEIKNANLGLEGSAIYFYSEIENEKGVYKLFIE